jgi:hypothetical protein
MLRFYTRAHGSVLRCCCAVRTGCAGNEPEIGADDEQETRAFEPSKEGPSVSQHDDHCLTANFRALQPLVFAHVMMDGWMVVVVVVVVVGFTDQGIIVDTTL